VSTNLLTHIDVLVLLAVLAAAVTYDVSSRRIPNRLVLAGVAAALALHAGASLAGEAAMAGQHPWSPLSGMLVGAATLLPMYALRACAAGDVKLMAVVGAFLGAPTALMAGFGTYLAGGLLSLAFLLRRGVAANTASNLRAMLRPGAVPAAVGVERTAARLPYAVAIAAGTVGALLLRLNP
jgi:prepilin peptidase CpaA